MARHIPRRSRRHTLRFGAVKVYAHRMLQGEPIPLFVDNRDNRAIDRHLTRICRARTRRRKGFNGTGRFVG